MSYSNLEFSLIEGTQGNAGFYYIFEIFFGVLGKLNVVLIYLIKFSGYIILINF